MHISLFIYYIVLVEVIKSNFFQLHGFTCGVDDLLLCHESDKQRKEILGKSEECSARVHMNFTNPEDDDKGL